MDGAVASAFADASRFFVDVVEEIGVNDWEKPGLGAWNVLELVAHANRAHTTLEGYLIDPQPPARVATEYFSDEAIAARARAGVVALGEDRATAVATTSARVIALVEATAGDATLNTPAGPVTLSRYVPSRIAELTIHSLDLIRALDLKIEAPRSALKESLTFASDRALTRQPEAVLFALSGRGPLPAGYSIY
jgi:hypothetical protein